MLWQKSVGIFVSPSLGNLPPSLNVASFDGLDDKGKPYSLTPPAIGATDALLVKTHRPRGCACRQRKHCDTFLLLANEWQQKDPTTQTS